MPDSKDAMKRRIIRDYSVPDRLLKSYTGSGISATLKLRPG